MRGLKKLCNYFFYCGIEKEEFTTIDGLFFIVIAPYFLTVFCPFMITTPLV